MSRTHGEIQEECDRALNIVAAIMRTRLASGRMIVLMLVLLVAFDLIEALNQQFEQINLLYLRYTIGALIAVFIGLNVVVHHDLKCLSQSCEALMVGNVEAGERYLHRSFLVRLKR